MEADSQRKELAYRCLIDAARSLSGAAGIDELVGQILSSSRDVMQCRACSVSLPDPESGDLIIRGTQLELKGQVLRVPAGKGISGRVFKTRLRENTVNAQSDSDHYTGIGLETKTPAQAMLTIPLVDGVVCHGVMQALNPTGRDPFYAYYKVDEDLLVVVGDASGKGIPAALESARVCTLISLTAPSCKSHRLSAWLADLNNVIQATSEQTGSLTTLAVLFVDAKHRRVFACSFGQFSPRYLSVTNTWEELVCPVHPPLGVFTAQSFAVACVPLAVGRPWLFLTHGFVEARAAEGAQFGESALAEALSASVSEQADPLKVLEDRWREFSKHGTDREDATALLLTNSTSFPPLNYAFEISPENIPDLRSFCEQWAAFAGLVEVDAYQVVLAFDEVLTNVYKHAYKSRPGPVRCDAWIDLTSLRFVITHWGVGLSSEANLPRSPEDSTLGGHPPAIPPPALH